MITTSNTKIITSMYEEIHEAELVFTVTNGRIYIIKDRDGGSDFSKEYLPEEVYLKLIKLTREEE